MAMPQDNVDRIMNYADELATAFSRVNGELQAYTALGGDNAALATFFNSTTYRGVTKAQFVDGVAALITMAAAFDTNKTNLTRLRGK